MLCPDLSTMCSIVAPLERLEARSKFSRRSQNCALRLRFVVVRVVQMHPYRVGIAEHHANIHFESLRVRIHPSSGTTKAYWVITQCGEMMLQAFSTITFFVTLVLIGVTICCSSIRAQTMHEWYRARRQIPSLIDYHGDVIRGREVIHEI